MPLNVLSSNNTTRVPFHLPARILSNLNIQATLPPKLRQLNALETLRLDGNRWEDLPSSSKSGPNSQDFSSDAPAAAQGERGQQQHSSSSG